jgi:hypothetical protein
MDLSRKLRRAAEYKAGKLARKFGRIERLEEHRNAASDIAAASTVQLDSITSESPTVQNTVR